MSEKIVEFRLGKGKTVQEGEIWHKKYIEILIRLPPEHNTELDFHEAVLRAEMLADQCLEQVDSTMEAPEIRALEGLEEMPWIASKWVRKGDSDRKARPGEDAWMRRSEAPQELVKLIEQAPNEKLELPPYIVSFAGNQKGLVVRKTKRTSAATKTPVTQKRSEDLHIEDLKNRFPEQLRGLLSFTVKEGYCIIKPRQFLGSENFAQIIAIVKGEGGDYVSAGKDSHFRVPLRRS